MSWKKLPKTKIGELLGVHRHTVRQLIEDKKLSGDTFPDVLEYVRREAAAEKERLQNRVLAAIGADHDSE